MKFLRLPLAVAVFAAALSGCSRADDAFDAKVHAYLLAHPEVIQEAMQKLQEKQEAQAVAKAKVAIAANRKAIEQDPRDFVANPNGKVTLTEFYDYRCPHCVNIAPGVLNLIKANPDLRVVFKEFPIFGAASERAAAGAVLVKQSGGDYLGVYHDFMTTRPLDEAAVDRILKAHGTDPARLDDALVRAAADRQLADVRNLAISLDIDGTPAFIIGDTLIPGEDLDAVKAAIAKARAKG
ncbi:DsbA family protein [Phenylobacterium montanum]|uniref:DsbA family protein n=1 Tax=Phenylobacterium montanum TaxID=2823693 RepID=A0A975FZ73_9CAUL|nr:DsbA family protein [Caulobacter sp. S6]QUD88145.1 DsbA family protein [Caulobacter sp. S6]